MAIDKKTVEHVAQLARIELKSEELQKLSGQLEHILRFIDKLKQANTEGVIPVSHILSIQNVLRIDEPGVSLSPAEALASSPDKAGDFFRVPKVID
jgi:aspartyl-tRNA(Asn)/glutamyl-tRNA(Gln) amidotransferase subunit C